MNSIYSDTIIHLFLSLVVFIVMLLNLENQISYGNEQTKNNIESNNKFKQIFDNLDESIIIVRKSDFKIEYVNQKFFSIFEVDILKVWDLCSG